MSVMAMIVKNNMSAVNTLNTLNKNSMALAKSLEKVSSGMKINSAADDASGYAISERMRVMVRSLDQADQNAQNGASMMKVAEGAVSSTVDILKTMKEKAINAANDSNTDADRAAIQKELDQSIDQIDDNALITYNGKTLVDGSKMTKGVATKTSLTNQSLSEDTKGSTKLVDLKDRNGQGLNIQTTDTLTMSYVIQGRNYSLDINVDKDITLDKVLRLASEPYTRNSPAAASAYSTYDSSCTSAQNVYNAAETAANNAYSTALNVAQITYNGHVGSAAEQVTSASNVKTSANNNYRSVYSSALTSANGDPLEAALNPAVAAALGTVNSANNNYNGAVSKYNSTEASAATVKAASVYSAGVVKAAAITSASTVLSTALSTAASTLGDRIGDLIPYKLTVDAGNVVGKAASGDTVYTANREKAITITAASAGVQYQISGLTFSVSDSEGKVKKSVNSVLDSFTESVRALNKSNDNAINLQVGTKANQAIRISLTDMRSEALGLKSSTGETVNISTQKNANAAINVLDNAIQKALDQQTDIGAVQMRLEMTSANLVLSSQNVQASESTIRDADMAKEMTEFTKNNVLLQAAQAMLAQANQSGSNVLSLLQ